MTIIFEKFESRSGAEGPSASAELGYIIQGTDDDSEVRTVVDLAAPQVHELLKRLDYTIKPLGPQLWEAAVHYGLPGSESQTPPQEGDAASISFDTTGGTQHLDISRRTVTSDTVPQQGEQDPPTPPDHKGLIGANDDKIEGVDVIIPTLRFSETHYLSAITFAYLNLLYRLTGTVNSDVFRGFSPGEVLFAGAQGSQKQGGPAEITYNFDCSPNVTNLVLGDMTVPFKAGWDYLWVKWEEFYDATAKALVKRPRYFYVEEVYPREAFAQLVFGPLPPGA
ncbi:MAG: hypothetical protein RIC55_02525 [Pirellulaceae bacterium]